MRADLVMFLGANPEQAETSGVPRSTLYAALQGKRLPSSAAVEAHVRSCGGDVATWLKLRNEIEIAVQDAGYGTGREFRDPDADLMPESPGLPLALGVATRDELMRYSSPSRTILSGGLARRDRKNL